MRGRHLRLAAATEPILRPEPRPQEEFDFERAFRRHAPRISALAVRMLGRPHEAEDLVQDVFLRLHERLGTLRDLGAQRSWLTVTALRMAGARLRRRRLLRWVGLDEITDYSAMAATGAPQQAQAALAEVYRVLDRVAPAARMAWILRRIEEQTVERTAELCGCSPTTAKRRIRTVDVKLQLELGDDHGC
jgi:RNA polymerase sigma-70 factor (ECF subfamily)